MTRPSQFDSGGPPAVVLGVTARRVFGHHGLGGGWGASPAAAFQTTYRRREVLARIQSGIPLNLFLNRSQQAIIDRAAIPTALVQHGYLKIRRGELLRSNRARS